MDEEADEGGSGSGSKGVLLAIAILLLWLAGFCLFVAFEGSALWTEQSSAKTGGALAKGLVLGLAQKAASREAKDKGS